MKIDFSDKITIYYYNDKELDNLDNLKYSFKNIEKKLIQKFNYKFKGFYEVSIYKNNKFYIIEMEQLDDLGEPDFDVTMYINSPILFEFYNYDYYKGKKIFYNNKYYVELDNVYDRYDLFEYGNIIYGDCISKIVNNGIIIE